MAKLQPISKPRFLRIPLARLVCPVDLPERRATREQDEILRQQIVDRGGICEPLVVRQEEDKAGGLTGRYVVLSGRRRVRAVMQLRQEQRFPVSEELPCYAVQSIDAVMDMKLFLILNEHDPLGAGARERVEAEIRAAQKRGVRPATGEAPTPRFAQIKPSQITLPMAFPERESPISIASLKDEIIAYGGILTPFVVRPNDAEPLDRPTRFMVLGGRRRLRAVWELQQEGHEKILRYLPCYILPPRGGIDDLRTFLALHSHCPLSEDAYEEALAAIERACTRKRRRA